MQNNYKVKFQLFNQMKQVRNNSETAEWQILQNLVGRWWNKATTVAGCREMGNKGWEGLCTSDDPWRKALRAQYHTNVPFLLLDPRLIYRHCILSSHLNLGLSVSKRQSLLLLHTQHLQPVLGPTVPVLGVCCGGPAHARLELGMGEWSRGLFCQQLPRAAGITSLSAAVLPVHPHATKMSPAAPWMHRGAIPPSLKMRVRGRIRGLQLEQGARDQMESSDLQLCLEMHLRCVPPKLINPSVATQVQLFDYCLELSPISASNIWFNERFLTWVTLPWNEEDSRQLRSCSCVLIQL